MKTFKTKLGAVALITLALSAQAQSNKQTLAVPYEPSPAALAMVEPSPNWFEVYQIKPGQEKEALKLLESQEIPPALALGIDTSLHTRMGVKKEPKVFDQQKLTFLRQGKPVEYDHECKTVPQQGDEVRGHYTQKGSSFTLALEGKVIRYATFGLPTPLHTEAVPLDLKKPEDCEKITASYLFMAGKLTLRNGKRVVESHTVMIQSIND